MIFCLCCSLCLISSWFASSFWSVFIHVFVYMYVYFMLIFHLTHLTAPSLLCFLVFFFHPYMSTSICPGSSKQHGMTEEWNRYGLSGLRLQTWVLLQLSIQYFMSVLLQSWPLFLVMDWSSLASHSTFNGLFTLQAGISSQLAQVCMCHLPSIHHLSNRSLLSLFLSPIKTAEHLIYLRYGKCDLMGVFQSNLILCRSQRSQVALSSLPSLLSSHSLSALKDGNQIPSVAACVRIQGKRWKRK